MARIVLTKNVDVQHVDAVDLVKYKHFSTAALSHSLEQQVFEILDTQCTVVIMNELQVLKVVNYYFSKTKHLHKLRPIR